jgi:hypothetical protein
MITGSSQLAMAEIEQTAKVIRGRPFVKGNGGRKPGSRNRATVVAAQLLEDEGGELIRTAIDVAINDRDVAMLKFLLDRLLPRDRVVKVDLPHTQYSDDDPVEALTRVVASVAKGKISPSEGAAIASLMQAYLRAVEVSDLAKEFEELKATLTGEGIKTLMKEL